MAWMIYGANGYTGRMIVAEAVRRGLRPVLAGRNAAELEALAKPHDLPVRAFPLTAPIDGRGLGLPIVIRAEGSTGCAETVGSCQVLPASLVDLGLTSCLEAPLDPSYRVD